MKEQKDNNHVVAASTLDARELQCPLPILKTNRAIMNIAVGERLEVLTTDPGSLDDFTAFCDTKGHVLHEAVTMDDCYRFVIERKA